MSPSITKSGVCIAVVAGIMIFWCAFQKVGAWLGVLHDEVETKIDGVLGPMKVAHKRVSLTLDQCHTALEGCNRGRLLLEVKAEQESREAARLRDRLIATQAELSHLGTALTNGTGVTYAGRRVEGESLRQLAEDKLATFKGAQAEAVAHEKGAQTLREQASALAARHRLWLEATAKLDQRKRDLEAKMAALEVVRQAAQEAGASPDLDRLLADYRNHLMDFERIVEVEIRQADQRRQTEGPPERSVEATIHEIHNLVATQR